MTNPDYRDNMDFLMTKAIGTIVKPPITGDDYVDRLHYFITFAIMVIFAICSGIQEYISNPINCWMPIEFNVDSDSYFDHINSYCWTHKLRYPAPPNSSITADTSQEISPSGQQKVDFDVGLMKWVTPVFIGQACLFKLPHFLWQRLTTSSGTDLQKIRDLVTEAQNAKDNNDKKLKMDEVVAYFEDWITGYRSYTLRLAGKQSAKLLTVLFCLGRKTGSYLSSLYIFIKILNILNVILNFVVLTLIMNLTFWKYGAMVASSLGNSGDWQDSANFPRLLLCDFVLQGGKESNGQTPSQETYEVQCLMSINFLLEKLFAFEWFWLAFLSIVTFVNLISWAVKIKPPCSTILFSKTYLKILKNASADSDSKVSFSEPPESFSNNLKGFIEDYLRSDGVFVVRLLELNASKTLMAELVRHLWNRYRIMSNCQLPRYRKDHRSDSNNNEDNNDVKKRELDSEDSVVIITESYL